MANADFLGVFAVSGMLATAGARPQGKIPSRREQASLRWRVVTPPCAIR